MQITTIGLDLAKHWFQIHGATPMETLSFAGGCGGAAWSPTSGRSSRVWSAWKPARQRTMGARASNHAPHWA
jgi:hypothetical protein